MKVDFGTASDPSDAARPDARCNSVHRGTVGAGASVSEQHVSDLGAASSRRAPGAASARRSARAAAPRAVRAWLLLPVGVLCAAAIVFGWSTRDELYVVPDEGVGYALGVAGLAMMLLLLLYSARKRARSLAAAGPLRAWFHVHMALGLLGPTAILYHSNFSLGSLNANVALFCMLTVSASGIVGRFIYTRIHYEYQGRVASFAELRARASGEGGVLGEVEQQVPEVAEVLDGHRAWAFRRRRLPGRIAMIVRLGARGRATRRRAMRAWRRAAPREAASRDAARTLRAALTDQIRAVRRVAEYSTYERFFALWHALHLPFCVGLYAAATVHVVAVHMY